MNKKNQRIIDRDSEFLFKLNEIPSLDVRIYRLMESLKKGYFEGNILNLISSGLRLVSSEVVLGVVKNCKSEIKEITIEQLIEFLKKQGEPQAVDSAVYIVEAVYNFLPGDVIKIAKDKGINSVYSDYCCEVAKRKGLLTKDEFKDYGVFDIGLSDEEVVKKVLKMPHREKMALYISDLLPKTVIYNLMGRENTANKLYLINSAHIETSVRDKYIANNFITNHFIDLTTDELKALLCASLKNIQNANGVEVLPILYSGSEIVNTEFEGGSTTGALGAFQQNFGLGSYYVNLEVLDFDDQSLKAYDIDRRILGPEYYDIIAHESRHQIQHSKPFKERDLVESEKIELFSKVKGILKMFCVMGSYLEKSGESKDVEAFIDKLLSFDLENGDIDKLFDEVQDNMAICMSENNEVYGVIIMSSFNIIHDIKKSLNSILSNIELAPPDLRPVLDGAYAKSLKDAKKKLKSFKSEILCMLEEKRKMDKSKIAAFCSQVVDKGFDVRNLGVDMIDDTYAEVVDNSNFYYDDLLEVDARAFAFDETVKMISLVDRQEIENYLTYIAKEIVQMDSSARNRNSVLAKQQYAPVLSQLNSCLKLGNYYCNKKCKMVDKIEDLKLICVGNSLFKEFFKTLEETFDIDKAQNYASVFLDYVEKVNEAKQPTAISDTKIETKQKAKHEKDPN